MTVFSAGIISIQAIKNIDLIKIEKKCKPEYPFQ
jgi:hypothetical protein